jgi:hypothetical protein
MKKLLIIILAFAAVRAGNTISAQCEGAHSAMDDYSWLSCQGTDNPNTSRTEEHWVLYDFGDYYFLNESHFWNYNKLEETANGISTMAVDYSIDGTEWNWWGDINLDEAPGNDMYYGEMGPDFDGLLVRYLLLSVVSNHGGPCYGFSEMKLEVDPGFVDIDEPTAQAFSFGVHPNPAKDFATVQLEGRVGAEITLYSPTGAIISKRFSTSYSTKLDLGDLSPGIYMVEVRDTDGARATQKLTVVH